MSQTLAPVAPIRRQATPDAIFTILANSLREAGLGPSSIRELVSLSPSSLELEMGIRRALAVLEAAGP
jgi:hypothetical protein